MPQSAIPTTTAESLFRRVADALESAEVTWCVLRDGEPTEALEHGGEIDVLVAPQDAPRLPGILASLGFVPLRSPGHAPHRFFVAYDADRDTWLKLDVVDRIALGRPTQAIHTELASRCLANRRLSGGAWLLSVEDELVTLLLHCLLDKSEIAPARRGRLRELCERLTDEPYVAELLSEAGLSEEDWPIFAHSIRQGEWAALHALGPGTAARLTRGRELTVAMRSLRDRTLRRTALLSGLLRPRGLSLALLAPDGAGKSTLAEGLCARLIFPTTLVYMGLYQKGSGAGARGLDFLVRLFRQWQRWAWARIAVAGGRFVVFDRYGLDALLDPGRPLRWTSRLRRRLLARCCPAPDLVFVLDAPGELLFARKGEHGVERLEAQRQSYRRLAKTIPRCTVVDVARPADEVRRHVTRTLWETFRRREAGAT